MDKLENNVKNLVPWIHHTLGVEGKENNSSY